MSEDTIERPEIVTDDHLAFLKDLRDSGDVNMCGASNDLRHAFGLSRMDAKTVHRYWMKTFKG